MPHQHRALKNYKNEFELKEVQYNAKYFEIDIVEVIWSR